jgi:hypothetical protein
VKLRGVVEIHTRFVREIPSPRYSLYWQPVDTRPETFVEVELDDLDEALAWARSRGSVVFVDLHEHPFESVRYQIGGRDRGLPPWPHPLPPSPPREPGYRGDVYVHDEARWDDDGFVSVHRDGAEELETAEWRYDQLEAAIDWGRERAPVVAVELLPDSFGWPPPPEPTHYSAGVEDPPGGRLPRLRPREGQSTMRWRAVSRDGFSCVVEAATRGEAHEKAFRRYVREVLKPGEGTHFVLGGPKVEPLDDA